MPPPPSHAGIGAGRNAYLQPQTPALADVDTPSMYSDPFEYSVAGGPGGYTANLQRSNTHATQHTLGPADSVSAYRVPYAQPAPGATETLHEQDEPHEGDARRRSGVPDRSSRYVDDDERRYEQAQSRAQQYGYDAQPYTDPYAAGSAAPQRQSYHAAAQDADMSYTQHGQDSSYGAYPASWGHGAYNSSHARYGSAAELPLRAHGASMGYADDEADEARQLALADDKHATALLSNGMRDKEWSESGALPVRHVRPGWGGTQEEKIERRRRGMGRQRWGILSYVLAVAYVAVFIVELIKAKAATGQAIQTRPQWNPMLGPPFEFLISFGARFVPCMRVVASVPTTTQLPCLSALTKDVNSYTSDELCPIWQICGLKDAQSVGQSWRYVTPIFLHAGFIHIIFNLLVQLTLCAQIERLLSTPLYLPLYFLGGLGGNLLGASFSLPGIPSVGASGAIYTCISVELIDLIYNWHYEYRAKMRLTVSVLFAILGFGIGLLPGLDNWAHIGGFVVGTLGGLAVCPSIHPTRRHRIVIWVCRVIGAALLIGFFVGIGVTANSEDPSKACTWCRYLTCLPAFSQCKGNGLTTSNTSSSNAARALFREF